MRSHKLTNEGRNVVCFCIQREVARVQHVDFRVWHILAITFRLSWIEREIVFAPDDKEFRLRIGRSGPSMSRHDREHCQNPND
jgi:hypothetical protein